MYCTSKSSLPQVANSIVDFQTSPEKEQSACGTSRNALPSQNASRLQKPIEPIQIEEKEMKTCHRCSRCGETFQVSSLLRSHILRTVINCEWCQQSFCQTIDLKKHVKIHTGENSHRQFQLEQNQPIQCSTSGISFSQEHKSIDDHQISSREKHFQYQLPRKHVIDSNFLAPTGKKFIECNNSFSSKSYLGSHLQCHTGEKPYVCPICQKSFSRNFVLTNHMRIHTVGGHYQCQTCNKSFAQKAYLTKHMRIYTGERPYECQFCNYSCTRQLHLTNHLRTHTGERPYECEICKKSFRQLSHLTNHMRIHTGEKPHECQICKKKFNQQSNLKTHMRIHTGERPYECQICKKSFPQLIYLTKHMRIHTGESQY